MSVIHGDCVEVLRTLAAESIDACVTDPPYGIGFMGKEWDTFKPDVAAKKQGLRQINKSPVWSEREQRKQDKYQINPNLKGRTIDGAVSSSQIEYDYSVKGLRRFQVWCEEWGVEVRRVLKPGAHILVCGAPRAYHRMACGLEDAGFEIRDCLAWLYAQGFPKSLNLGEGLGTALKPAHEPIVLARKPFKGTVAGNVARFGTGALNVDACRIEVATADDYGRTAARADGLVSKTRNTSDYGLREVPSDYASDLGRWPPNVCLDDLAALVLDEQSGELDSGKATGYDWGESVSDNTVPIIRNIKSGVHFGDSGGASRFFYCAKPSREERDYGTEGIQARQRDASRKEGNPGGDNPRNRGLQPRGNFHPTVKPVELMRWLVKLITPINGTVLDPFCGSGTTGMACRYEQRGFVGIEREAEYLAIANARIAAVAPLFADLG